MSSDDFDAIQNDSPPPIITTRKPDPKLPQPAIENPEESCWDEWDCQPTILDLDPELLDLEWDSF